VAALRALDKAIESAASEGDHAHHQALADARTPLAEFLEAQGMRIAKTRRPRGSRTKG